MSDNKLSPYGPDWLRYYPQPRKDRYQKDDCVIVNKYRPYGWKVEQCSVKNSKYKQICQKAPPCPLTYTEVEGSCLKTACTVRSYAALRECCEKEGANVFLPTSKTMEERALQMVPSWYSLYLALNDTEMPGR